MRALGSHIHIYMRARAHTHTSTQRRETFLGSVPSLSSSRPALENQYRETRKQRQGVDSNLRAGSIPVPPLLAVLSLCIPSSLYPINPLASPSFLFSVFLSLSVSLFLYLFLAPTNTVSFALFIFTQRYNVYSILFSVFVL